MTKPTALNAANYPVPRETGFEKKLVGLEPGSKHYRAGKFQIIVSPPYAAAGLGWHMSISHLERYPSWDEIAFYRYKMLPGDITMVMYLPPIEEYVNIHENCFHLHQEMC